MKPNTGITLPPSFVVTVSLAGTEVAPTAPVESDILTVAEVAEILKYKPSFDLQFDPPHSSRRIRDTDTSKPSRTCETSSRTLKQPDVPYSLFSKQSGEEARNSAPVLLGKGVGIITLRERFAD